jgi:xylulokinase
MDETRTAAKWLWLRRNRPEELASDATWLCLTDFPTAWWAGQAYMSSSLAPRTACLDVHTRSWIPELVAKTQAPRLPGILKAGSIIGGVRSGYLRECGAASAETALVVGGHDHPIAASLIRRMDGNARVDSLGTANLVYGETPLFDDVSLLGHLAFSVPPSAKGFACLGVLEFSASVQNHMSADVVRQFLSHQRLPGHPPNSSTELRELSSNSETQLRRTLESLSFRARHLLGKLDSAGVPHGNIYTTGGWSRSKAFVELRASVFGRPIVALGDLEMTALGAALFGAEATSGKVSPPEAMKIASVIDPVPHWIGVYQALAASDA